MGASRRAAALADGRRLADGDRDRRPAPAAAVRLRAVRGLRLAARAPRGHPHGVWLVPVAVIPWANLHGSFPLVFVLLLFAWLQDRRTAPALARTDALAAVAGLCGEFHRPFGLQVWSYVWDLSTHPVVSHQVAEWGPPSIHSWTGRFFFLTIFASPPTSRAADAPPGRLDPAAGARRLRGLGLLAIRGVVWWGLYAPVVVAGLLQERERADVLRPTDRRSTRS